MPSRSQMTGWYDPARLLAIGIRVSEATIFGKMFDRRELIAALDPFDRTDFDTNCDFSLPSYASADGNFWLDFCADTGDGWRSTHAVARLLARDELRPEPGPHGDAGSDALLQGRLLVFGGDQVYPTPTKEDYDAKLRAPFDDANRREAGRDRWRDRFLFALPGNHDWYDDLTAFTRLFCNRHPGRTGSATSPGRSVCGRETRQTRSYFALRLPNNWWLCAWDVQLDGYVDQTQISFFEHVAQEIMPNGANIILCVGQPVWAYCREEVIPEFINFAFASLIVTGGFDRVDPGKPTRRHNLRLVLTGDTHNYSHFVEQGANPNHVVHLLAHGGGGAFLHPTHWLADTKVEVEWKPATPLSAAASTVDAGGRPRYTREFRLARDGVGRDATARVFPDQPTSRRLTWRNLLFVAINPKFGVVVGLVALFSAWLLHFVGRVIGTNLASFADLTFGKAVCALFWVMIATPWPLAVIFAIGAALIYFADHKNWRRRVLFGAVHTVAQVAAFLIVLFLAARYLPGRSIGDFWIVLVTALACGLVNPTIMGLYLLIALNGFSIHWNEAFASLRIENYKGFIRLKFDRAGNVTVYPIVIERVPASDDGDLHPRLAEAPIELRATP